MGFQHMSKERRLEVARRGGANNAGRHTFDSKTARAAGRRGAAVLLERHGAEHMAELGRKGGAVTYERHGLAHAHRALAKKREASRG